MISANYGYIWLHDHIRSSIAYKDSFVYQEDIEFYRHMDYLLHKMKLSKKGVDTSQEQGSAL